MMILMNKKIKIKFAELLDICNITNKLKKNLTITEKRWYTNSVDGKYKRLL